MAANRGASGPSSGGSRISRAWSISAAASAMARDSGSAGASVIVVIAQETSFDIAQRRAAGPFDDGLHLRLGLRQLALAMLPQGGATLIVGDRLGEAALAALQRPHDLLQLLQRVLEGQAGQLALRRHAPPCYAGLPPPLSHTGLLAPDAIIHPAAPGPNPAPSWAVPGARNDPPRVPRATPGRRGKPKRHGDLQATSENRCGVCMDGAPERAAAAGGE